MTDYAAKFPECEPRDAREGYYYLSVKDKDLLSFPVNMPLPKDASLLTSEADVASVSSDRWLQQNHFGKICHSPVASGYPTVWYVAKKFAGNDRFMLANHQDAKTISSMFDHKEFEFTAEALVGLAHALDIKSDEVDCLSESCIVEKSDGTLSSGKYRFSLNSQVLGRWIEILSDRSIQLNGISVARRAELLAHFKEVYTNQNQYSEFQKTMLSQTKLGTWVAVLMAAAVGYPVAKDVLALWNGRVKTTDFGDMVWHRLSLDPESVVAGREAEARMGWSIAGTHPVDGFRHVIFNAPTRIGKDLIVERMIQMQQQGDPIVPEQFRNAPVHKLNAADFHAGTNMRGNVADKVTEIAKAARRGPVVFAIPEIDLIFMGGGSSSGTSEVAGKLFLSILEDPVVKQNLLILGTTSRGEEMLRAYPDLQGRANWPTVHEFSLADVAKLEFWRTSAPGFIFRHQVIVPANVVDAAAKLAETVLRPLSTQNGAAMPRFPAVQQVLNSAVALAKANGDARGVTIEHVIHATEQRAGVTLDRAEVDTILKAPLPGSPSTLTKSEPVLPKPRTVKLTSGSVLGAGAAMYAGQLGADAIESLRTNDWSRFQKMSVTTEGRDLLAVLGGGTLGRMGTGALVERVPSRVMSLPMKGWVVKSGSLAAGMILLDAFRSGEFHPEQLAPAVASALAASKLVNLATALASRSSMVRGGATFLKITDKAGDASPLGFALTTVAEVLVMREFNRAIVRHFIQPNVDEVKSNITQLIQADIILRQMHDSGKAVDARLMSGIQSQLRNLAGQLRDMPDVDELIANSEHEDEVHEAYHARDLAIESGLPKSDADWNMNRRLDRLERHHAALVAQIRETLSHQSVPSLTTANEFQPEDRADAGVDLPSESFSVTLESTHVRPLKDTLGNSWNALAQQVDDYLENGPRTHSKENDNV